MVGIIVTGHGQFATGMVSAAELLTGRTKNFSSVDFTIDMAQDGLEERILEQINIHPECHRTIILTDIVGGTPFKVAVKISLEQPNVKVVAGSNLPVLLQMTIASEDGCNVDELLDSAIEEGRSSLCCFDINKIN